MTTETLALDFTDLAPAEIPVNNLLGKNYVLKEANGLAATKFRSMQVDATKMGPDGRPSGFSGEIVQAEIYLVGMCLFEKVGDVVKAQPVGSGTINTFPNQVVKQLVTVCRKISKLDNADTEEEIVDQIDKLNDQLKNMRSSKSEGSAGNSRDATTDGSD